MLEAFILRVRAAFDAAFPEERAEHGYGCTFRLVRCRCGAPTWQLPCPSCGYYPRAGTAFADTGKDSAARESFVASATARGGVAAWYFAGYKSPGALSRSPWLAGRLDELAQAASAWTEVPSPGDVWDAVCAGEHLRVPAPRVELAGDPEQYPWQTPSYVARAQRTLDTCMALFPDLCTNDGGIGAVAAAGRAGLLTAKEWETQLEFSLGEPLTRPHSEAIKRAASLTLP